MRCLESLSRDSFSGKRTVFLIDNAQSLGRSLAARLPSLDIEIDRPARNLGFAEGCARGMSLAAACGADFILLLNNDAVVESSCLDLLVKAAADSPETGLLSPHIVSMTKPPRPWYVGGSFSLWSGIPVQARRRSDIAGLGAPREVDYATGCAMLIRPAVVRSVGSSRRPPLRLLRGCRLFAPGQECRLQRPGGTAGPGAPCSGRQRPSVPEHLLQHAEPARGHAPARDLVSLDRDRAEFSRAMGRVLYRARVPAGPARVPPGPRQRSGRLCERPARGAESEAWSGRGADRGSRMRASSRRSPRRPQPEARGLQP